MGPSYWTKFCMSRMGCSTENTMKTTASAMHDDDQRRQNRGQTRDLPFDVALVGDGDILQHGLELAGTLAHRHHVHHHRGELARTFSGAAMDSPSRMASRASSTTFSSTTLLSTFLTISSAFSTGTPAASMVARARANRAAAMKRASGPISQRRSFRRRTNLRPRSLLCRHFLLDHAIAQDNPASDHDGKGDDDN